MFSAESKTRLFYMKSLVLINESTASRYGYTLTHNILPKQDGKGPPSQVLTPLPGQTFHVTA